MGPTGAGKSTAIDLILGLLRPDCGSVLIDGMPLTESGTRSWQTAIGYVPQVISLLDDTIARNIALGLSDDEIDPERLQMAARRASIHEFIVNELEALRQQGTVPPGSLVVDQTRLSDVTQQLGDSFVAVRVIS